ncbi:MAG: 50S ribosomal protein L10 [Candidatus Nomurabacteria bacterium]|jgi:large subunit ribosomal protein L10|nr:50S ribosomal protein L10 [Candidatus Nomurabacteria bacterium]
MAISKTRKQELVAELNEILSNAKMTVFAQYTGTSVKDLQVLRRAAREAGVTIKIVKNRLVRVAMSQIGTLKDASTDVLRGQVLYAFSNTDEVAPAQVLDKFAKNHPQLVLIGAFSNDGENLDTAETTSLAKLPSKNELIAQVIATLESPVNDVTNALSGLGSILNALEAKATN